MRNAIIVHGRPSKRQYYILKILHIRPTTLIWQGWLKKQLSKHGIEVDAPNMPRASDPNWDLWCREVEKSKIGPQTILVGHSCGAGFWIRYLSEHPDLRVGKVVLVAPWLGDDYGAPPTDFFEGYKIDPNLVSRTKGVTIFYSNNDFKVIHKAVSRLKSTVKNARYRQFNNYGHFTFGSMKTRKFPEVLEECLTGNT